MALINLWIDTPHPCLMISQASADGPCHWSGVTLWSEMTASTWHSIISIQFDMESGNILPVYFHSRLLTLLSMMAHDIVRTPINWEYCQNSLIKAKSPGQTDICLIYVAFILIFMTTYAVTWQHCIILQIWFDSFNSKNAQHNYWGTIIMIDMQSLLWHWITFKSSYIDAHFLLL